MTENVMFIILNLVFLTILGLFLFLRASDAGGLEERTAKDIALMIDAARPGMVLTFPLSQVDENSWFKDNFRDSISIDENLVTVKLSKDGGHSYSFFNDVDVSFDVSDGGNVFMTVNERELENAG